MMCPLCGAAISAPIPAKHLPHFFRCASCGGYYPREKETPVYPETYFAEGEKPSGLSAVIGKALRIFLWLRAGRIRSLVPAGGAILDYGCGNGKLIAYLKSRGIAADGFDPSPSAVALAQKNGLSVYGAIPEKRYDLIMFWHSLEHTDTPLADLQAVKKYLAPNGRLLIAVPNGDSLEAHLFHKTWFCYDWPFHRVHYTPRSIRATLAAAGFRARSIDMVNLEYTVSSLVQTALNVFLPKNALYAVAANRRVKEQSRVATAALGTLSLITVCLLSPILLVLFLTALLSGRTAAFVAVAERAD
jgi:SAM-dependent methyltransferase